MATKSPVSVAQTAAAVASTGAVASGQKGKQNGSLNISCDILDDLASRFIINVPVEERENLIRICFQMELAHWFYLDFYCAENKHKCGIKQFAQQMFKHVPFLQPHWPNVDTVLEDWKQYKLTVPTYGAILLSEDLKHVLLVQSFWAKSSWGFPKGKINENEEPVNCAIREVYEETGYDIRKLIRPTEYIEVIVNYQFTRLYLVPGVPLATVFVPKTRNEIKCCEWFPVDVLPVTKHDSIVKDNHNLTGNSFFMILPFVKRLKRWLESFPSGGKAAKGAAGKGILAQASNSPVFGRESTGKQKIYFENNIVGSGNKQQQQQQGQKQRQRHKSMGELEQQPQQPIQILQRGKASAAAGTPNVANRSQQKQQQQQQQQQQPREDAYQSNQRAASVVSESYRDFSLGVADESSAMKKKFNQTLPTSAQPLSANVGRGGQNVAAGGSERLVKSQTKRKLFANETAPAKVETENRKEQQQQQQGKEAKKKAAETDDESFLEYLLQEARYDRFRNGVYQWTHFQLEHSTFLFQPILPS
uniref:m7GpppN-mRNA hydrolase n=3 Tax=gambiae species complex TaxID=44542 RepID=A0A1S4H5T9_ANOGA